MVGISSLKREVKGSNFRQIADLERKEFSQTTLSFCVFTLGHPIQETKDTSEKTRVPLKNSNKVNESAEVPKTRQSAFT